MKTVLHISINLIVLPLVCLMGATAPSISGLDLDALLDMNSAEFMEIIDWKITNAELIVDQFAIEIEKSNRELDYARLISSYESFIAALNKSGMIIHPISFDADVSSTLKNGYSVSKMFDQKLSTAWVEGTADSGKGEWIAVKFGNHYKISSIIVFPGYFKNKNLYYANNSVSESLIRIIGKDMNVSFPHEIVPTYIGIDSETSYFEFKVIDIFTGSKYTDLCVSEILFLQEASYRNGGIPLSQDKALDSLVTSVTEAVINQKPSALSPHISEGFFYYYIDEAGDEWDRAGRPQGFFQLQDNGYYRYEKTFSSRSHEWSLKFLTSECRNFPRTVHPVLREHFSQIEYVSGNRAEIVIDDICDHSEHHLVFINTEGNWMFAGMFNGDVRQE